MTEALGPRSLRATSELLRIVLVATIACAPLVATNEGAQYIWTDVAEFTEGTAVPASLSDWISMIRRPPEGTYFRPAIWLFNFAENAIAPQRPDTRRGTNVLLHWFNAVMLGAFCVQLACTRTSAALASAIFAAHPIAVTPTSWVADRTDLIALAFVFMAASVVARSPHRWRSVAMAAACLFVGMFAKESVATVALFAVAAALQRVLPVRLGVVAAATAAAALGLLFALMDHSALTASHSLSLGQAALVLVEYASHTCFPVWLRVCDDAPGVANQLPGLLAGAGSIAVVVVLLRKSDLPVVERVSLLWWMAALLPTVVAPLAHARADRYVYFALAGLSVLFGRSLSRVAASAAGACISPLLVVGLVACSWVRSEYFRSDSELWRHERAANGSCAEGLSYLGLNALREGRYAAARELGNQALSVANERGTFVDRGATLFFIAQAQTASGDTAAAMKTLDAIDARRGSDRFSGEVAYQRGAMLLFDRHDCARALPVLSAAQELLDGKSRWDSALLFAIAESRCGARVDRSRYRWLMENAPPGSTRGLRGALLREAGGLRP